MDYKCSLCAFLKHIFQQDLVPSVSHGDELYPCAGNNGQVPDIMQPV